MKRLYGLLTALVILLGLTVQAQAVIITYTDSSWRVTASDPGPGITWNTDLLYNDAGWESATELYDIGDYIPGYAAQGIWSSGGVYSSTETTIWARKNFNLASLPVTAVLDGGFDDDGEIYVNGVLVVTENNGYANTFADRIYADITPHLVVGDNLIAYRAYDNFTVYGYNHSSWLQVNGEFSQVPEPGTLLLLSSGLIGLGFFRRKFMA